MVVEPRVGNRVERSLAALDATMHLVWGPGAINLDKLAEEGAPSSSQLLWGLHVDFEKEEVVQKGSKQIPPSRGRTPARMSGSFRQGLVKSTQQSRVALGVWTGYPPDHLHEGRWNALVLTQGDLGPI